MYITVNRLWFYVALVATILAAFVLVAHTEDRIAHLEHRVTILEGQVQP